MSSTRVQNRKLELIQWLSVVLDALLLGETAEPKDRSAIDWWDEISDAEKESISKGLIDADAGRLRPHSETRVIYE